MNKKGLRMTKRGKITIIVFLLFIIILVGIIKIIKNINKDYFNLIEQTNKYDLKIKYEKTNLKKLDNKVKEYIINERNLFLKEIASDNKKGIKYEFILETQTQKYKNIYFTHSYVYKYTGGAHYIRSDEVFIYDRLHDSFLDINDFIIDKEAFNKLSIITKQKVINYLTDNNLEIDNEIIDSGVSPTKNNYKYFYLNNEGLTLLIIPYQVTAWSSGEIRINISWSDLEGIIKEEYFNSKKESKDKKEVKITQDKRDINEFKDKKIIAFTFDDGPNNKTTNMLLDGLDKYNAKVTFFVLGSRISYNSEVLKRAYTNGNEIGSHSYSHRNLIKLSDEEVRKEIDDTNNAIKNVIGVIPKYLRPPYGSINSHVKELSSMYIINWNVDSIDWKLKDRNKIKDEIVSHAHDGAIVLVHDIYEESVMGALLAMEELSKQDYAFVTISELFELKGETLDYTKTYFGY